jgi:hypothetical protein
MERELKKRRGTVGKRYLGCEETLVKKFGCLSWVDVLLQLCNIA